MESPSHTLVSASSTVNLAATTGSNAGTIIKATTTRSNSPLQAVNTTNFAFSSLLRAPIVSISSQSVLPISTPTSTLQSPTSTQPTALGAGVSPSIITIQQSVGPFEPKNAIVGGIPSVGVDVPITAVFLALFIAGAVTHFTIHELNQRRGHKFHLSDAIFDFCMVRTVTCIMRIVWATRPTNQSIVVAALVFENAGVVVLFAVNAIFSQRIIRAVHPNFGWNPIISQFFVALFISIVAIVILNIASLVTSFFTLNPNTLDIAHDLSIFGASYTTFLAIFPIPFVILGTTIPSPTTVEKFGTGRFRTKIILLMSASTFLFVGALIRLIGAANVRPKDEPGWFDSKKVFYTTGFMLEIFVVAAYAIFRVDLRFHVPDGCTGPGDYSRGRLKEDQLNFEDDDVRASANFDFLGDRKGPDGWTVNPTKRQLQQRLKTLRLDCEAVGAPIDTGESELLLYMFRVKKEIGGVPVRPPRISGWMGTRRSGAVSN